MQPFRIGIGYDVHRLGEGRKLVLGGVEIPHPLGLVGHSDADVLIHAVCDALLGAAAAGDIGTLFPDTDPALRGADSAQFLREAARRVNQAGYAIGNIDAVLICQQPKLSPWYEAIRARLGEILALDPGAVGLKAKTAEHLDDLGQGLGIACHSVALLIAKR